MSNGVSFFRFVHDDDDDVRECNTIRFVPNNACIRNVHSISPLPNTPPHSSFALAEIQRFKIEKGLDIQAAVASRTDEPGWAATCMQKLALPMDGKTTLADCFGRFISIHSDYDKRHHFRELHEMSGVPYEAMCFFDNEIGNIRSVSKLGVTCIYTPNGMTREAWEEALRLHGMEEE